HTVDDRARTVGGGKCLIQGLLLGSDPPVLVAERAEQSLVEVAAGAVAAADAAGLPAAGAGAPESGVGAGAGGAQRSVEGAAADGPDLAAARAASPALLAGGARGLSGGGGDVARGLAAADGAGHDSDRAAGRAQRALWGADAAWAATRAADAGLLVGWVNDEAMRAEGPTLLVAGGCLPHGAAPRAGLGAGAGDAVATQPLPADGPVQPDNAVAVGADKTDDGLGAEVGQCVDQTQHTRIWDVHAGPNQQVRP